MPLSGTSSVPMVRRNVKSDRCRQRSFSTAVPQEWTSSWFRSSIRLKIHLSYDATASTFRWKSCISHHRQPTKKRKWRCSPAISGPLLTFSFCFVRVYLDARPSGPLSTRRQLRRPSSTILPTLSMSITVYRRRCRRAMAHQSRVHISRTADVHGEHRFCR